MNFNIRKSRRNILIPQLTPLIDVFTIIIIFLILGSFFSKADVIFPKGMILPKSKNKESPLTAPQVQIREKTIWFSVTRKEYPLELFQRADRGMNQKDVLRGEIRRYISDLPKRLKVGGILLNVAADQATPYRNLFDVLQFFRSSGFQTTLFVAEGV